MKLYELPRDKGIRIKAETFSKGKKLGDFIIFHHIDGMYSYCTVEDMEGDSVVHLSANTELKKVGDHYEIVK